jgi:hypothetical protein
LNEFVPVFDKFNLDTVPDSFLSEYDTITEINALMAKLEHSMRMQSDIDLAYNEWCNIVSSEMYDKIAYKRIDPGISSRLRNKKPKQWWNPKLSTLWTAVYTAKHNWLKSKNRFIKTELKHIYVNVRKQFDKEVQKSKR